MDLSTLETSYFKNWRLKADADKTEACDFYLNNKESQTILDVRLSERRIKHHANPKYLSITNSRSNSDVKTTSGYANEEC